MRIIPRNNWVHVDLENVEAECESLVLLPEDYKKNEPHYSVVSIKFPLAEYSVGDLVIVPTHIIQDIEVKGEMIHLIQSNHIMAIVQ